MKKVCLIWLKTGVYSGQEAGWGNSNFGFKGVARLLIWWTSLATNFNPRLSVPEAKSYHLISSSAYSACLNNNKYKYSLNLKTQISILIGQLQLFGHFKRSSIFNSSFSLNLKSISCSFNLKELVKYDIKLYLETKYMQCIDIAERQIYWELLVPISLLLTTSEIFYFCILSVWPHLYSTQLCQLGSDGETDLTNLKTSFYTGCFFTGPPPKISKYQKVNLG